MAADTRSAILESARLLFNQHGMENVSLRDIATELEISLGNLTYHFKHREDIVYELYLHLVGEIDDLADQTSALNEQDTLTQIRRLLGGVLAAFLAYRFIMDNLVQVVRAQPRIQTHYRALTVRREQDMLGLFTLMVEGGWMIPEASAGQFETLVMQITIMGNFFLPSAEVFLSIEDDELEPTFDRMITQLLSPYLTELGHSELLGESQ